MNIQPLRKSLRHFWAFLWEGWRQRHTISKLCDIFDALPQQEQQLRGDITAVRAELAESKRAQELAEREAESVAGCMAELQTDLRNANQRYQELLVRREAPEERVARDALHLAKIEIADLQKRLESERLDHAKTKGHVEKLWLFISRRARVDTPAANGTIRKILQEIESR